MLIAIARIVKPPAINRGLETNRLEYKTRHLIDGRIIDCDQRISLVAGYMTDEVQNLSPFTFIHQDDVRWVIVALRQSKFILLYKFCIYFIISALQCMTVTAHLANPHTVCLPAMEK